MSDTAAVEYPILLAVDDSPDTIALLYAILKDEYTLKVATSGQKALELLSNGLDPDLILLDVLMPNIDGFETCKQIKTCETTAHIPVIFLTGKSDIETEKKCFEYGAEDFVSKPPSPLTLKARVKTQLRLKQARDFLSDKNAYLEEEVNRRTKEISQLQDVTMLAMGSLAETRDNETGNHIKRTQTYIRILAGALSRTGGCRDILNESVIERLYKSAPLHDIGKIGIPDTILLKPGPLTPEEFEIMKQHTIIGRNAILTAEESFKSSTSFLAEAHDITWTHHEKWDGSGYPRGLSGCDIPLSGRLMAVVDVYDALRSKRVYKDAFSHDKSVEIITQGKGTHFDPAIIDVFLQIADTFREISEKYQDTGG